MSVLPPDVELRDAARPSDDPDRGLRFKRAAIVSLVTHSLLLAVLYQQRMEYHPEPLKPLELLAVERPDAEPQPAEYALEQESAAPGRENLDQPLATESPTPPPNELARHAQLPPQGEPQPAPPMEAAARPELAPRLPPLRWRQDALAHAAPTLAKLGRREPAGASLPDTATLAEAPPIAPTELAVRATDLRPHAESIASDVHRAAAPRIAPDTAATMPELPAKLPSQDLPRQRAADPLLTIALDSSRTHSRRRVDAAPLPEMPSDTERLAEQTTTHATRPVDAQANNQRWAPDSPLPDAAAAAGAAELATTRTTEKATQGLARAVTTVPAGPRLEAGTPDTQTSGRLATQTLRRRRSADADPGLRSGGGVDRPRRSRGPSPAAPVLAPLPNIATAPQPQPRPHDIANAPPPVAVETPIADGGLGRSPADDAGLNDRLASRDSSLIHLTPAERFNRRVGGEPTNSGNVRRPSQAYAQRGLRRFPPSDGAAGRPSTRTEAAIEHGLQFLAGVQLEDGRWEFQYLGEEASPEETQRIIIHADAAATGLAVLSFLGAGYDHLGGRYEHQVQGGLDYLIRIQAPSGELFPERDQPAGQVARFYGHGIAALALCEAYGMTGDPELRHPAQAALDYLIDTQHPELGGWRYVPGTNADLSASGWQLLALKGGEMAGLTVSSDAYGRLRTLLERCREPDGQRARFRYNPWASPTDPRTRHGLEPSTVMTSVGTLMQLYLDGNPTDERLRHGADHLLANLPQLGGPTEIAPTGTLGNPQRDTYYWYYATQVMFRLGGPYWQTWNERLHPLLITSQITGGPLAGSWDPHRPVPDKWADYGGRLYVTSLNLLSLEVAYRQLPLYNSGPPRIADRPD